MHGSCPQVTGERTLGRRPVFAKRTALHSLGLSFDSTLSPARRPHGRPHADVHPHVLLGGHQRLGHASQACAVLRLRQYVSHPCFLHRVSVVSLQWLSTFDVVLRPGGGGPEIHDLQFSPHVLDEPPWHARRPSTSIGLARMLHPSSTSSAGTGTASRVPAPPGAPGI